MFPALSVHRPLTKTSPVSLRSAGCRMTIMPGYHTSAYNLGAQSHWRPLRVMANNKSELPPRCTSPVPERSDFPPVTGGRSKLSKRRHHVGSVCSVIFPLQCLPNQSSAARPMKVRAKSVSPRDSRLNPQSSFVSARCQQKTLQAAKETTHQLH